MTPPSPHRPPFPAPRLQGTLQRAVRHVVPRAVGALCLLLMTAAAAQAAGDAHSPISPSTSAASAASTASSPPATSATPAAPAIGRIQLPARPVVQPKGEGQARTEPATPSEPGKREAGGRGAQLREAIEKANSTQSGAAAPPPAQFTFTVPPDKKAAPAARAATRNVAGEATAASTSAAGASSGSSARTEPPVNADEMSRQYIRARAAALGAFAATPQAAAAVGMKPVARTAGAREPAPRAAHGAALPWGYEGAGGPLSWGQLKPEYAACAAGQRQSPIAIDDSTALLGPAEPLAIEHQPSTGTVVHTGRTLRVDVKGANALTVRGKRYVLEQIEFHQPAEERINGKGFAMSAHLLHRAADGQMAMVAVLLEPGTASPLVDQVVTYLPLDVDDRVGLPPTGLDLAGLLPQDARYYQFFGSLSAPPCTEDVLWIVFKQPMTVSASQLKLFGQLFPNNARPLQPLNGRVVRAAQ